MTGYYNYVTNITWLIVLLIVIVIVLWLIAGGQDEEYIGFKPLMPGVRMSEVVDSNTMALLGLKNPRSIRSIRPYDDQNNEDFSTPDEEEGSGPTSNREPTSNRGSTPTSTSTPTRGPTPDDRQESEMLVVDRDYSIRSILVTPRYEDLDLGTREERQRERESLGERACRQFLERYYRQPFARIRPDFLINPQTGQRLELDCYNSELGIACEYNGKQHYVYPNYFHRTKQQFVSQVRRDQYKYDTCDRNGIYLIVVPYTIKHKNIPQFIRSKLPDRQQNTNQ